MSAHTKGPWALQTVKTSCGICHKIGPFPWKHGKQNHACIYVDYPNHDGRGSFEDELAANARLIATAPTLLEALRNLVAAVEDPEADSLRELLAANAAIAAAEPPC